MSDLKRSAKMKIIGAILLLTALLLLKHSLDAIVAEAHIPSRLDARIAPVIDPVFSASISDLEARDKKKREVVDAAYSVTLEIEKRLMNFAAGNFIIGGIQAILGTYLLVAPNKRSKTESAPRGIVVTGLVIAVITLLSVIAFILLVLLKL